MLLKRLAQGSLSAFAIQGGGAILLLGVEMLLGRWLGAAQFGLYALANAWVAVLGLIAALGFNQALLKFVPVYEAQGAWAELRGILRFSNAWVGLVAGTILIIGLGLLINLKSCCIDPGVVVVFAWALGTLPFFAWASLRQASLRGLGAVGRAFLPEYVMRPLLLLFCLFQARKLGYTLDAATVLALNFVAVVSTFAIGAWWLYRSLPRQIKAVAPVYRGREWFGVAMPLLLIIGFNLISNRIDVLWLGWFVSTAEVGIYAAASRIAEIVVFALVSANAIAAPLIARLHAGGEHAELQRLVRLVARGIFAATLPVALLILFFGRELLTLFGPEFAEGYIVLAILVGGQLVNALSGPVGYLLTMTGHQRTALRVVGGAALLNLTLNALLIPRFGMLGAAVATAMSLASWNLLMLRAVRQKLDLHPAILSFHCKRS